ncbi:MAG TPA: BamA/TamA family outer membrane protein [Kofleriaceae bacterium]|nr:BamA/TamA family outer membrane protein [Kofleriaceae bacterium]
MRILVAIAIALLCARPAAAGEPTGEPMPLVGFRVRGPSKLTDRTLGYLARVELGDRVAPADLPRIQQALISSGLFEKVEVALEDDPRAAPGGVLLVATLDDKHSWIIAPTVFALPGRRSVGVGFAENNFRGENKKLLLYGQLGDRESLFFGTFLDPSARGSKLVWRADVFLYRRINDEYANPPGDPTDDRIARSSTATYLGGGLLAGWQLRWWLSTDLRLRAGHVTFRDGENGDDPPVTVPVPQTDGWDVSAQWRATLDRRHHRHGVTWGPYLQLMLDTTIPGLDDYDYTIAILRAYQSWRFFAEHQLELRVLGTLGYHLPFHEETSLGGATDLRGYAVDRYRGDTRLVFRTEYSVPIAKWRSFAFRALAFWDTGYVAFHFPRPGGDRDYLPTQLGTSFRRNDVGAGLRIYVGAVVLPLLGLDLAYGIEARAPEVYFQLGLTDF